MLALADSLKELVDVELSVATFTSKVQELKRLDGKHTTYYLLPNKEKKAKLLIPKLQEIAQPEIVHIHGTEYPYGKWYAEVCGSKNIVVSIQGIISVIARYYLAGMSNWDIIKSITFHDLLKTSVYGDKRSFEKRGESEIATLKMVHHVIGRTSFDKAHVHAINPQIHYYFCNESLRPNFYSGEWSYNNCTPYQIFISSASYPIKGLHQLLKALPLILEQYPNTQLHIAGGDITKNKTLFEKAKLSGYGNYLRKLINKLDLSEHVVFLGTLDADNMKKEYLSANLFVCPSAIENSPNSLGEAQLLGVPCLASFAGGIPDMMPTKECGELYRFEEFEMLAAKICDSFEYSKFFDNTKMRYVANLRHNRADISENITNIYKTIFLSLHKC